MRFIIYKNSRYSNIKFTNIDECKEFISMFETDTDYLY